jgi:hypothetical protein
MRKLGKYLNDAAKVRLHTVGLCHMRSLSLCFFKERNDDQYSIESVAVCSGGGIPGGVGL